jgi:RNA polymerase sigma-70 factor (sigma-E family)
MAIQPADFEEFVASRSGALLRAAWLLTGDERLAEDLLQAALAKSWRRWERARNGPETYVRKVLVSTYLSWWRRRWRGERPAAEVPEPTWDARDDDPADRVADRDAMRRALARLSRQQRAVVVLRYAEDLSIAQTAELLGCSAQTVRVQAHRAIASLRADPTLRLGDVKEAWT